MDPWREELYHSAKGSHWKKHKYIAIKNGVYIYNNSKAALSNAKKSLDENIDYYITGQSAKDEYNKFTGKADLHSYGVRSEGRLSDKYTLNKSLRDGRIQGSSYGHLDKKQEKLNRHMSVLSASSAADNRQMAYKAYDRYQKSLFGKVERYATKGAQAARRAIQSLSRKLKKR